MLSDLDKNELKQEIQSNQYEIIVVSFNEMDEIVRSFAYRILPESRRAWQRLKTSAELGANYYSTADDLVKLRIYPFKWLLDHSFYYSTLYLSCF